MVNNSCLFLTAVIVSTLEKHSLNQRKDKDETAIQSITSHSIYPVIIA